MYQLQVYIYFTSTFQKITSKTTIEQVSENKQHAHLNNKCFASKTRSNANHSHVLCTVDEHL